MTEPRIVELEQQAVAVVADVVPMTEIADFVGEAFSSVMATTARQGVKVTGPPFTRYLGAPTTTVEVEAGFPTSAFVRAEDDVRAGALPACRAVEAMHVGPYETLGRTYDEALRWAGEHGLSSGGDMWEEYLTDPTTAPDPATWRTRVLIPVG
ncbi:AraC family transcriptional regulator [Knoellia flava TL1]|uniref:AraC family transcriptional regulator n=1 Tax=Knoellia flava TL1 TaxID=1385518 RepID=A0ABR4XHQ4_9MICO|nr:GyrI-like domain-containing protein [Knoellia flava]KGN35726.1 AraC family transcriptional regulator [Knoellia flava TL1]